MPRKKTCSLAECGQKFVPKRTNQKYCNRNCQKRANYLQQCAGGSSRPNGDPRKGEKQRHQPKTDRPSPNPMGRPRNQLRAVMRNILRIAQEETIRRLENPQKVAALNTDDLRKVMDTAAKYGLGQPQQKHEHAGKGGRPIEWLVAGPEHPTEPTDDDDVDDDEEPESAE